MPKWIVHRDCKCCWDLGGRSNDMRADLPPSSQPTGFPGEASSRMHYRQSYSCLAPSQDVDFWADDILKDRQRIRPTLNKNEREKK